MALKLPFGKFFKRKAKQADPASRAFVFPVGPYGSNSWLSPSTDNPLIGEHIFLKSTTLSVCIRRRANAFASVPLKLMRKKKGGEAEEVENHPLKRLLNDVNPHDTGMDLKYKTSVFLDLTGDAYWLFENDLKEIWVPRSSQMRIVPDEKNFIKNYRYFPNLIDRSKFVEYPPERVLHFKYFNPADPWYGAPPLLSGGTEIATDWYASEYQVKFFENGAMPVKLFQVKGLGLMTEEQLKEFMEKWFLRYGGPDNFHKTGFVNEEVTELSSGPTMRDMEFNVLREFEREQICSMYDVPPMLAGIFKWANYANSREQRKSFWQDSEIPRQTNFVEILNQLLIPRFNETENLFFIPDFSKVEALQETSDERMKNTVMIWNSGLAKRNEARAMVNLPAVSEEEDTYKPQQQSLIDLLGGNDANMGDRGNDGKAVISRISTRKILEPEPVQVNGDRKIPVGELVITHKVMGKASLSPLPQLKDDREDLRKGASTRLRRQEGLFAEDMVKFFNAQKRRILKVFDEVLPPEKSKSFQDGSSQKQIEGNGDDILKAIFDKVNEDGKLRKALIDRFRLIVEYSSQIAEADLGMVIDLSLTNPAVRAFFELKIAKATIINETTSGQIRERIMRAIEEGWSTVELRDNITDMFEAISEGRAMTIAQTETTGAYNFGTLETWKQSGLDMEKEWLSANDDKVRDSHQAVDGEKVALTSLFSNGLLYPGDPSGPPEQVINCFLPGTKVKGSFIGGIKSKYIGPVRDLITASGQSLSVTPNHPILTPEGFIPARSLRKGDYLIRYTGKIHSKTPISSIYEQNKPALIENIFETLRISISSSFYHLTTNDLHGDARWIIGKVNIVGADSSLLVKSPTSPSQQFSQSILMHESMSKSGPSSSGSFDFNLHGIVASPSGLPSSKALSFDKSGILLEDRPFQGFSFGTIPKLDAFLFEMAHQCDSNNPDFFRKFLQRNSRLVTLDKVCEIRDYDFSGHVYDLQSISGLIIAQNIITSNCRCTMVSTRKDE